MFDSGFEIEFQNGRFPLRFVLLALTVTITALSFYYAGDFHANFSYPHLLTVFGALAVFCTASIGCIYLLRLSIARMPMLQSMTVAWLVITMIAVVIALTMIFAKELANFGIGFFNTADVSPGMGYSLVLCAAIFTPVLLLLEKRLHADREAFLASESEHFSNLGFRIRPHFLFNSLNSVAGLITRHPTRAETALYNLADVFRVVMADKRQLVPLQAELDMADKYLYLEKIRLGNRLQVSSKIDPNCVGLKVPVFLLQPMLENAVYHGIETRFKGGKISLVIQTRDKHLVIKITNPLPEAGVKRHVGNRVAQQNLRQRIIAIFGNDAALESFEAETSFNVIVRLPL